MDVSATTTSSDFIVKVPKSRKENRELKEGFVDDNNDTLSYMNVSMLRTTTMISILSISIFIVAIAASLYTDYKPTKKQLKRYITYGSTFIRCHKRSRVPANGLPSILNLLEVNAVGNALFRVCVCIPMIFRLFASYIYNVLLRAEQKPYPMIFRLLVRILQVVNVVEVFALALFSIVTTHSDSPDANKLFKIIFAMMAGVNMVLTATVHYSYSRNSCENIDHLSTAVKLLMACVFCYLTPEYFLAHYSSKSFPICHSYVPRQQALMEYTIILTYCLFHLTTIIDIRYVRFISYPRTCSGECQPLDPENFAKQAEFEHCRAFEFQQRSIYNSQKDES